MNYTFLTLHFTTPENHGRGIYTASKKELQGYDSLEAMIHNLAL